FQVDLSEQTVSPNGVHIAGTFQGWNPGSTAMTDAGGGIYTYTATFQSGYYHEYKFMNGITWDDAEFIPDPCAFNGNRFLTIPDVNTVVDVVCFASCEACPPPPEADITFQVDMSNEMVSINGVHISGTFNGFDPAATPMTDMGNNVYAVTLTLTEGDEHMYRFVNGNDVTGTEVVPPECSQEDGLRVLTVPGINTTLDLVCFGSCGPCIPPPEVNIIFNVDMSNETVSPDGVHLAGSFQGWDPTTTEMTETDAGVYAVTLILVAGDHHTYKFINGITFDDEENVPAECGEENGVGSYDRFIDIPENDSSLLAVCFGSCEECPPPPEVDISFQVDMSMEEISPDGIHLAGSFNNWNYSSIAMTDAGGGIYTATITLTAYEHQTYRFVNGTTLVAAEIVPAECAEGNPFAGYKRFFDVPDVNTTLDVVCFAECGPCIPPPTANVTFQVDMSTLPLSGEGVHVAGSFQGWDPATTELTDQGNGVYAVTLELLTGEHHTYKYINGNLFDNQETVPEACGEDDGFGSYNRFFDVPENDTVLDVVCFGMCAACPPTVEVTFQVDMAEQTVSPDGVHIAGSFQGWITDATAMTLVREGVYTYTTTLFSGEYYEYKFINGITWDDAETVPAGCAQNENRFITATGDTVLSVVCFGSCVACAPPSVDVTFRVDMANETVSPDGVHIAGSFQGWDPAATPMTETTINIYSVTLALAVGEHHTYKFINGNTFDDQETVPEACGEPDGFGGFNRFIDVPDENTILTPVCFGGCNPCISGQLIDIPEGWSGLSAFAMPTNTNIETIFSGIFSDLIILQSMDGMYYPEQSINTIIDWESQSAYKIKVTDNALLNIEGNLEMNKTLDIPAGWSMMPVIHNEPVDVVELFSVARSQPIVVKGIASLAVYWPEFFINTLVNLEPGKAYYVKMDIPGSVTFPDYNVKSSASTFPVQIDPKTPWNKVTRTSSSHLFAIVANKVNNLQSGDVIGVFTTEGICAGLATIDNPDVNNVIAAYADENSTSAKDGFIDGEPVLFKIYRPVTSEIFDLNVEFDAQQPNGGQFTPEGLSVIKSLKVSPSGIGNVGLASIYLFPNPAEDNVTISGIQHFDKLVVYDAAGMVEKSKPLEGNNQIVMNTNDMAAGIYFVKISGKQHHVVKKLMVK
nr:T9SS type A sorting domain-containing protein [Bacteroidota bacterium]